MTDLTEKTTALDKQSALENSEEITQTPSVWKEIFIQGVWKNNSTLVQLLGFVRCWLFQVLQQMH